MTVYLILAAVLTLLGLGVKAGCGPRRKKVFLWFAGILLVCVSGGRAFSVGADTQAYVNLFQKISYVELMNPRYEPGFIAFFKLLAFIWDNPGWMLWAASVAAIGPVCGFVCKYSKGPVMSMVLYVLLGSYFFQMTGLRQSMASSVAMMGFSLLLGRRRILSALFILLACAFHTAAAAAFLPYAVWVGMERFCPDYLTPARAAKWTFLISAAAFTGYPLVMRLAGLILPKYTGYFSGLWSDSNYVASLLYTLVALVFFIAGALYLRKKRLDSSGRFGLLMLSFQIIFSVLSMRMEFWSRIGGLFNVYTAILWAPEFLAAIDDYRNRWLANILVFVCSLAYMTVILLFRPEWTSVVPYSFRW